MMLGYCAICVATRHDSQLRIGYSATKPGRFMLNVRRDEPEAELVAIYWVIDSKVAKSLLTDLADNMGITDVSGSWLMRRVDEIAERLRTCAKRRGVKLCTGQELAMLHQEAVERELASADKRLAWLDK